MEGDSAEASGSPATNICQQYLDEHLVEKLESSFEGTRIQVFHQRGRPFAVVNLEAMAISRKIDKSDQIGYDGVYISVDESGTGQPSDFIFTGGLSRDGDTRFGVNVFEWGSCFVETVETIVILNRLSCTAVMDSF